MVHKTWRKKCLPPLDFRRSFIAKQENQIEHNLEIKFDKLEPSNLELVNHL